MGRPVKPPAVSGLGMDIVEVARIKRLSANPRFLKKVFTSAELAYSIKSAVRYERLAARFAVKEAVIKALDETALPLKDIEVSNSGSGRPAVTVKGRPSLKLMVSISHTKSYACASVIAFK